MLPTGEDDIAESRLTGRFRKFFGGGSDCGGVAVGEGRFRDITDVTRVPLKTLNVSKVPFGTPAMSPRCPSGHGRMIDPRRTSDSAH
jgi:hypothetical protein